jgi:hypothetical protein
MASCPDEVLVSKPLTKNVRAPVFLNDRHRRRWQTSLAKGGVQ